MQSDFRYYALFLTYITHFQFTSPWLGITRGWGIANHQFQSLYHRIWAVCNCISIVWSYKHKMAPFYDRNSKSWWSCLLFRQIFLIWLLTSIRPGAKAHFIQVPFFGFWINLAYLNAKQVRYGPSNPTLCHLIYSISKNSCFENPYWLIDTSKEGHPSTVL